MQISKRELSRKAELKEYCGGGVLLSEPQILAGAESVAGGKGPQQEQGMLECNVQVRTGESSVCVWGRGWLQQGTKDRRQLESPGEAGQLRNGQKCQDSRKPIQTFPPSCRALPFPPKSLPGLLQRQLTAPQPNRKVHESTVSIQVQVT